MTVNVNFQIGIFNKSLIGKGIKRQSFDLPEPKPLPGTNMITPYLFLGDEAFPLLQNLMKPYPRLQAAADKTMSIFNYRLSRSRRVVENAFGLLSQKFRIFLTPIQLNVKTCEHLVTSACILHNIMIDARGVSDDDPPLSGLQSVSISDSLTATEGLLEPTQANLRVRNILKDYFNGIGAVDWQENML